VNVVIATVLFLFLQVGSPIQEVSLEPRSITGFFVSLMAINVWLAIFNLIPAFPMDGGRVLRALLATRLSYVRATKVAATAGQAMAFLGVYLGFVLPAPILVLVSLFIFIMAGAEASAVRLQEATKDIPVSEAMMTSFETVTGQDSIGDAVDLLLDGSQTDFPVVDIAGRLVGLVRRDDLIGVLREHGDQVSVTCAMSDCDVTLKAEMPLSEALAKIQSSGFRTIPVTGRGDRLIGLLSLENIGELVMVRSALEDRTEKRLEGAQPTNRGDGVLGNFPVRW
jgi:CBS domain-containing protein